MLRLPFLSYFEENTMLLQDEHLEPLSGTTCVIVSKRHRFNTDTLLLADFSMPKAGERCAELGTGCGVIPLLWCSRSHPEKIFAWEIQQDACSMAQRSAAINGFDHKIEIQIGRAHV